MSIDWEEVWKALGVLAVLVLLVFISMAVLAPHVPTSYYVSIGGNGGNVTPCIFSSIDWDEDPKVFCSSEPGQLLNVLTVLNQTLKH